MTFDGFEDAFLRLTYGGAFSRTRHISFPLKCLESMLAAAADGRREASNSPLLQPRGGQRSTVQIESEFPFRSLAGRPRPVRRIRRRRFAFFTLIRWLAPARWSLIRPRPSP